VWKVLSATLSPAGTGRAVGAECDRPSLAEVEGLFERLAYGAGGDLWVEGQPGDRFLGVSGGPSRFLVSCMADDYGAYNLVDPEAAGRRELLTLSVGGVLTTLEVGVTVDAGLAVRAIRYFHAHGEIDPGLRWE
jgi:hypothetical protein